MGVSKAQVRELEVREYTLDRSPIHHRAHTTIHSFIHTFDCKQPGPLVLHCHKMSPNISKIKFSLLIHAINQSVSVVNVKFSYKILGHFAHFLFCCQLTQKFRLTT